MYGYFAGQVGSETFVVLDDYENICCFSEDGPFTRRAKCMWCLVDIDVPVCKRHLFRPLGLRIFVICSGCLEGDD